METANLSAGNVSVAAEAATRPAESMKIRNLTLAPQVVHTLAGRKVVNPGDTLTDKFAPHEADNIKANVKVWGDGDKPATMTGDGGAGDAALRTERDGLRQQLANIAALFGPDVPADQVQAKVEELLAQIKTGLKPVSGADRTKTIADAVAKLDDKNADHWTQAGLPAVTVVNELAGLTDVTREEISGLATPRTRATQK